MRTDMECTRCGCLMDTPATAFCHTCADRERVGRLIGDRAKDLVKAYMAHVIVDMNDVHKAFFELKLYTWALTIVRNGHWEYDSLGKHEWNATVGIPALRVAEREDQQKVDIRVDWR